MSVQWYTHWITNQTQKQTPEKPWSERMKLHVKNKQRASETQETKLPKFLRRNNNTKLTNFWFSFNRVATTKHKPQTVCKERCNKIEDSCMVYLTTFTIHLSQMYVCEYTSPMDPSWVKYIMKKCVLVESQLANTNHQHIFEMNSFPLQLPTS